MKGIAVADSAYREVRLGDARTLAYAEYGSSSGQAIIYCHGVPSSRVEADLIVDSAKAAALNLRIIVPDRPGMGHSDYQVGRRIVDWPDDVLALADALGVDTFAVLGSSGGAPYAAACGARVRNRVRVVGLLGAVAPPDTSGGLRAMSRPMRMTFLLARWTPALLRALFRLNLRAMRRGGARAGERMAAWAPEPDRTLLQRGERDRNVPVASGRYLASAIPNCRATFYPDEAHLSVPLNHQEEIFGALAVALAAA